MTLESIIRIIVEAIKDYPFSLFGFALFGILIYLENRDKRKNATRAKPIITSFSFLKNSTIRSGLRSKSIGIIFGLYLLFDHPLPLTAFSPITDEGHILCVGGSGMGKTTALLIPTLISWAIGGGYFIVLDISGDINGNVNVTNKLVYEPGNYRSIPFNIFGEIDRLSNKNEQDKALAKLSLLLLPDKPKSTDSADDYYTRMGRKMLIAALIAYYHQGHDFCDICDQINASDWKTLLNFIDSTGDAKAISYINDFVNVDERLVANTKQTCSEAISIFVTDDSLRSNVRRPRSGEQSFEPCKVETNNCFILINDDELEYYKPLTMILFSQVLDYCKSRSMDSEKQILLCLDEAASFGAIDLLQPLRKFRKRKVRLFILTQSLADIDYTWGKEARLSMMTNFKYKVILECSEPDEQEYWARLIGKELTTRRSLTSGGDADTLTESETQEYRIDPSSLANMGDTLLLIYPGGYMKLYKNYYFRRRSAYEQSKLFRLLRGRLGSR